MVTAGERHEVVIVGAGMAGLACATVLREAGVDVVVLEAGPRVGGRVRTVRDRFVGGQHAESGAEWVDSDHERVGALLARHGLRPEGEGQAWRQVRSLMHLDGRLLAGDEVAGRGLAVELDRYEAAVQEVAAAIADPALPTRHPDATLVDSQSVASVLDEVDLGPLARLVVTRSVQGEFACEPAEVSLLFVAQQRALSRHSGTVRAFRVTGGLSALVSVVASPLGESVRLGVTVTAVEQDDRGAVVTAADGRRWPAEQVVLACSLIPLRQVRFDPPLLPPLFRAVHELGYGTVTKTAVQYRRRCWPPGYLLTDGPVQRVYEPTADQPGAEGILMAYMGGDGGRAAGRGASEDDRVAWVLGEQAAIHRCVDGEALGGFSRAWAEHPRFGGAYAVYQPGQVTAHWDVLRRPHGRLLMAGEHTATVTGYVEGAVESGERAAAWILGGT